MNNIIHENKPKVIYIAGMGHSGSTLLDFVLGNMPQVFSTGEIVNLFLQIYRFQKGNSLPEKIKINLKKYMRVNYQETHCSCRQQFCNCTFWKKIINALSNKMGYDIWESPLKYRLYFSPFYSTPPGFYFWGKVQRKLTTWSHQRSILWPFEMLLSHLAKHVAENNWRLFDVVYKQSNCDFIVDSSKDIHRFHYLYQHRPGQIYLIILVRNVLGVASSYKKLGVHPFKATRNWVNEYKKVDIFTRSKRGLNYLIINYDNLVSDTENEIKKIHQFLGIPFDSSAKSINTKNHHLVGGNKIRYLGHIKIKKDKSWQTVLSNEEIHKISPINKENKFL